MTLKDFELKEGNHFVAMEYYRLMLNRTFLVLLLEDCLVGLKANGLVSIETGDDFFSRQITQPLAIRGDLQNPYSYIKARYIKEVQDVDLLGSEILVRNKANFRIDYKNIGQSWYDQRKKWGMGYYPHDGKVYIATRDGKKREFIILGNQSGDAICRSIADKVQLRNGFAIARPL